MQYEIFPIFPTVIAANRISDDLSMLEQHIKELNYDSTNSDGSKNSFVSSDHFVLDSHPYFRNIILNEFNKFKNEALKLETTEFDITTSWGTKTHTHGYCQYHNHKNSYYSGVLYFSKSATGNITFSDVGINNSSFETNPPSEYNLLNYRTFDVWPDKNLVIFFPSNVYHKINIFEESTTRYSLAFNLIPVGDIGKGDSRMIIKKLNID